MVNEKCYELGTAPNAIRELSEFGQQKAKIVGEENIYDFSLGNPSVPAPAVVDESIKAVLDELDTRKVHGYSSAAGFEETRAAIAADLNNRFGVGAKASELFLTCGAAPAVISVIKALAVSPESEIMLVAPYFSEYKPYVTANNARAVIVPADTASFQINFSRVESLITKNTQAIIINSPNNPSGVVYTAGTIAHLGEILTRKSKDFGHPIYIISDEPYRELVYGDVVVPFIPKIYKNTIVCYSYSKSLSLPGERIGYVYVPGFADDSAAVYASVAGAARICGHICPPTLIQHMLARCADVMPDLELYNTNRTLLYEGLREIGYECAKPDGAFYLFVKAPNGNALEFSDIAKREEGLLVVPGDGFGCPGFFRLSYCVPTEMIQRSFPAFKNMFERF